VKKVNMHTQRQRDIMKNEENEKEKGLSVVSNFVGYMGRPVLV